MLIDLDLLSEFSSFLADLLIKHAIKFCNYKNSPVFICNLDAEKAFDSYNWYTLFCKLVEKEKSSYSSNHFKASD